jgi:methylmalonyl-CoA mutase cobalamin-binding subunit
VGVLQQVVVPFTHEVGELWRVGTLKVAHEHLATAVLRNYLSGFASAYSVGDNAPLLLVTTPVGQWHEVGALIIAAAAVTHGWRVTYLGPNLPAEEIAGAALQNQARAVALSIVYPEDDPRIPSELRRLRQSLPPETAVLAGGRAAPAYAEALREINALISTDLPTFYQRLEELRVRRSHAAVSA